MDQGEVKITLTAEEASLMRTVFLPANPNKMRKAAPQVVALARKLISQVENPKG